jgi:hypothetical protein
MLCAISWATTNASSSSFWASRIIAVVTTTRRPSVHALLLFDLMSAMSPPQPNCPVSRTGTKLPFLRTTTSAGPPARADWSAVVKASTRQ